MLSRCYDINKITKFSHSYLLHRSIVEDIENLLGNTKQTEKMRTEIDNYGLLSIENIHNNANDLTKKLEYVMNLHYDKFTKSLDGKTPQMISDEVFSRMLNDEYCFAGGFGHMILSDTVILHTSSH